MKRMPKFLTEEIAMTAVRTVFQTVNRMIKTEANLSPKRSDFYVVILVPEKEATGRDERVRAQESIFNYPECVVKPVVLYEHGFGDKAEWTANYDVIARHKAQQLWYGLHDGRTDVMPHLLCSGDSPYYGGVMRDGIACGCSGVEPYFDRMIAGMVVDICIACAYHAWMKSEDRREERDILSC